MLHYHYIFILYFTYHVLYIFLVMNILSIYLYIYRCINLSIYHFIRRNCSSVPSLLHHAHCSLLTLGGEVGIVHTWVLGGLLP